MSLTDVWFSLDEDDFINENVLKIIGFVEWESYTSIGHAKELLKSVTAEDFDAALEDLYWLPSMEVGVEEEFNEEMKTSLYDLHTHNLVQNASIQESIWAGLKDKKKKRQFF